MVDRFTFRGIQSEVDLGGLLTTDSRLRRLRGLLARRASKELAEDQARAEAGRALTDAGEEWVAEHWRCVDEIVAAWDDLATAWRAGRDRPLIEPRLRRLPTELAQRLHFVPDAESQVRSALRVSLTNDLVHRLPAARPRREELMDLGRRLLAGLEVAYVDTLRDPAAVDQILERRVSPVVAALASEVACEEAPASEIEPCGWCDVGETRVPVLLSGPALRVVGTWACPPPKSLIEQRYRAVEGLAVAPRQGIGLWGPWAPTLWNLEARGSVFQLDADSGCGCAAFSPDARRAAAGGWGFVAWDVAGKQVLMAEDELDEPLHALAFHPNGRMLYTGGEDGFVRAWDLDRGRMTWAICADAPVRGLAVRGDGESLVAGTASGEVRILATADGSLRSSLDQGATISGAVATSACGRLLLTAGGVNPAPDGPTPLPPGQDALVLWEVGASPRRLSLAGHTHNVIGVGFLDGGKRAVSASEDGTVRVWCCESGSELARLDLGVVRDFPTAVATDGADRLWVGTFGGWVVEVQAGL